MPLSVTNATFDSEVTRSTGYVLVDFWAAWCGPCLMLAPILEEIEKKKGIKLIKVDVDSEAPLAQKYNVQSLPTVLVFHHGQLKKSFVGAQSQKVYLDAIQ